MTGTGCPGSQATSPAIARPTPLLRELTRAILVAVGLVFHGSATDIAMMRRRVRRHGVPNARGWSVVLSDRVVSELEAVAWRSGGCDWAPIVVAWRPWASA